MNGIPSKELGKSSSLLTDGALAKWELSAPSEQVTNGVFNNYIIIIIRTEHPGHPRIMPPQ
jgi:hypothetical protein